MGGRRSDASSPVLGVYSDDGAATLKTLRGKLSTVRASTHTFVDESGLAERSGAA